MDRRCIVAGSLAAAAVLAVAAASAQAPAVKRTELMRAPIEGVQGKESAIFTVDFAPGAATPRHSHSGQEFVYVLEGQFVLEPDGQAPRL